MKLYEFLDSGFLKKSYAAKFFCVAFIGTHIPLVGILTYWIVFPENEITTETAIILILLCTLIACGLTLFLLNKLLAPIKLASRSMNIFREERHIESLPTQYTDEAGSLLTNISSTLTEIERLSGEQKNFFSLIVHDLRNPISAISGLANLIHESDSLEEVKPLSALAKEGATECLRIIQDTMDIIKSENFTVHKKDKKEIRVHSFLVDQLASLESYSSKKDINFDVQIKETDTLQVQPKLFSHILQNILTNATKFSYPKGKVIIRGSVEDDTYQLSISDEGVGFDPETKDKIFNKFTTEKKEGTNGEATSGIGLYLTKTLLEKHSGRIEAFSQGKNQGATFKLYLPVDKVGMKEFSEEKQPMEAVA